MDNQVAIVDYDCLSPLGTDLASSWEALTNNRSGISFIDRYAPDQETLRGVSDVAYGGQIPLSYDELAGSAKRYNRSPEPAFHAVKMVSARILERLGFNIAHHNPQRIALLGATALSAQISQQVVMTTGRPYVNFMLNQCHNIPLSVVAKEFGIQGPSFSISGACASGNHALYLGYHFVKTGLVDCALIAGYEFPIVPVSVAGFEWLRALYKRTNPEDRAYTQPEKASRPYSKDRRGFLVAEGVGVVLLGEAGYVKKQDWPIQGFIRGGYLNSDGDHFTRIVPENVAHCMREALKTAACNKEDIDCINAHATSTPVGDAAEMNALYNVFGDQLATMPVVANKSQLGHSLGASSILEFIMAVEGMKNGVLLPTLNYIPDPDMPKAAVPAQTTDYAHQLTLLNSFGFGGTNGSLVVGRLPAEAN